jgi:hypothetical protein
MIYHSLSASPLNVLKQFSKTLIINVLWEFLKVLNFRESILKLILSRIGRSSECSGESIIFFVFIVIIATQKKLHNIT